MRAVAKIFGARESEHPCNFCQQFKQRPNFVSTFKLNGTIRYPLKLHANSFSRMFIPLSLSNFFGSQILARKQTFLKKLHHGRAKKVNQNSSINRDSSINLNSSINLIHFYTVQGGASLFNRLILDLIF